MFTRKAQCSKTFEHMSAFWGKILGVHRVHSSHASLPCVVFSATTKTEDEIFKVVQTLATARILGNMKWQNRLLCRLIVILLRFFTPGTSKM